MDVTIKNIKLVPHPTARSQAISTKKISAGSVVLSVPAFTSALLEAEKGRRCDTCFRLPPDGEKLKKCTGCASYFYCDTRCQKVQWDLEHKRVCKSYSLMISYLHGQQFSQHERMDVILLSHFLGRTVKTKPVPSADNPHDPFSVFLSLLPGSHASQRTLDSIPKSLILDDSLVQDIYSRFGNNNFTIHSHLNSIGHGVFPLASRLFNHSCIPNAAPRYVQGSAQPVLMEVVALRDTDIGEEICIPYLDPALTQSRSQIFQYTYGFTCQCGPCRDISQLGQIPKPPDSSETMSSLGDELREYVGVSDVLGAELPTPSLSDLPLGLRCALHESYMEQLSEQFSKASHEGDYNTAFGCGRILLALYLLIYPTNYPQIGLHLLELAKTHWNALTTMETSGMGAEIRSQVRIFLSHANRILRIYGKEGDEYGPLDELVKLDELLSADT
ncbi:hypothetical protein AGABI2DRAFT_223832 [Agaricus bisporus var. bisporus H97]|uniref:hypothetical protein n=1 Tax=Agaricus bisporus var. bisporus (strain H97 / ATCC MYA-4626 / FGSC 10389) TaxID=936046 RepID=UPI00029F6473|nr:hypothetical protein AGABI2DRAFT_223832 [Agaricus bisporus var. bisporus H97]EKV45669.1 hypothetical protein AGABI2DRAFT_223832 [Agaricus bisporus var. bisporus H97]